jgi:putative phage-type endonuclease
MQQNTPAWLEARKTAIGASDAPIILGISPWSTPNQLWHRKKGLIPEQEMSSGMSRGHRLEEEARQWFEKRSGLLMFPAVKLHKEHKYLMASLDGITMEEDAIVEIKCPKSEIHEMAKNGKLPDYYMAQVQHQLLVTGLPMAHYCSYDGQEGVIVVVERDEALIDKILYACAEFYAYMTENVAPPLCERDYAQIIVEEEHIPHIRDYIEADWNIRALEKKRESLKQYLQALTDDGNCDLCDTTGNQLLRMSRIHRDGVVDWKALCKARDIPESEIALYRKSQIGYWKIRAYGEKD